MKIQCCKKNSFFGMWVVLSEILFLFFPVLWCGKVESKKIRNEKGFIKCSAVRIPAEMRCIPGGSGLRGSERMIVKLDTGQKIKDESPESRVVLSTFSDGCNGSYGCRV